MRIEYFNKETGLVCKKHDYFVLDGTDVWRENYKTYESKSGVVGFENFIHRCFDIGWRVVA